VVAAGVFLSLTVASIWIASHFRTPDQPVSERDDYLAELQARLSQGKTSLAEGDFHSAAEEFAAALATASRHLGCGVTATQAREIEQFHRQAALLADLSSDSIEEIARQVDGLRDKEAQMVFARRFKGKAIVFYAEVRIDAAGRYHVNYRAGHKAEIHLDLTQLGLLQKLPLQDPCTLLFGARLGAMRRELTGSWLVSFEPKSGVLLTDPGAAAACCFGVSDERQLDRVLQKQAAWVAQMPEL
jgi:hypothetical protein